MAGMFPDIRSGQYLLDPKREEMLRRALEQLQAGEYDPRAGLAPVTEPTRRGMLADPMAALGTPIRGAQGLLTEALTPTPPTPQTMPLGGSLAYADVLRRKLAGETFEPPGPEEQLEETRTGAEAVAEEAQAVADPEAQAEADPEVAPTIERPGDLARARAEQKIAQLTALRGVAERLGRPIPVAGTFLTGGQAPPPFVAGGIREALGREDVRLADISAEEKLRLQAELGGAGVDYAERARKTLNEAAKQLASPSARLRRIRDSLDDSVQIDDLLTGDVTETAFQQALTLVIKSMGREVGNIAERERRNYGDIVGIPGMFRKGYRWAVGKPSPGQIASVKEVARKMTVNLRESGEKERALGVDALWKRNQRVFQGAGLTKANVLEQIGSELPLGGDMVEVVMPDGKTGPVHRSRLDEFLRDNPGATAQ